MKACHNIDKVAANERAGLRKSTDNPVAPRFISPYIDCQRPDHEIVRPCSSSVVSLLA